MQDDSKRPAGSPTAGGPAFLAVGLIRRPHGVSGETLVEIYTDFPQRLKPKKIVYAGEKHLPLTIRGCRPHKDGLLLAFEGISTPEDVGRFRNQTLYVSTVDRAALPPGEFYHDQLLGLSVITEDLRPLGKLAEIITTGANDVFVIASADGSELLLPAIPDVILDIDLPTKMMKVHLLPGLIDHEH